MKTILGYKVNQLIYEGSKTIVYRGERKSDGLPVILKLLKKEFPSLKELALFRHQYEIVNPHNIPGIVKPCSLENYENGYLLVMEDYGGISLGQWRKTHLKTQVLSISEFLPIAFQVAEILEGLHQNRIVHKDLKPANILIHPETQQIKLIDFSISSIVPKETQTVQHPNVLEGTLAYLSPEQTGRMNRGIDYRTDFYSLGVTFYELLTGELPFQCNDPTEVLHCHLAKQPEPPQCKRKDLPQGLANVVLKLMAKNAEDRYQSALGLKFDLEKCLSQWKETGKIEPFDLGKNDRCDRFLIGEKLYGREAEIAALLAAFERVRATQGDPHSHGNSELMLVTGFSGIGKTSVINEIHKPILAARGYFIQGKFDRLQRDIPLSALVSAFKDAIEQLLTESPAQVEQWKANILAAVGESGQVIVDLIPELEWLIGTQPPVAELEGIAAQHRFNWVFGKFIQVFPTQEHPLVLFLDDLQWADLASLQFLQVLMTHSDIQHLLVLGAYRDNEVSPTHPLMFTLDEIRQAGTTVNTLTLTALQPADLNQWIADTLGCPLDRAMPLTGLVESKTHGNPFFSHQFLHALYEENLISWSQECGYWQYDIHQVRELALSSDVVEFVVGQLGKLPKRTQKILQFAACIGNHFDLDIIARICEQEPHEIERSLGNALQAELILPITAPSVLHPADGNGSSFLGEGLALDPLRISQARVWSYKFIHDRVQQAAYSTLAEKKQRSIHLKIGQLLWQDTPVGRLQDKIFEIVNHLNLAVPLIRDRSQLRALALLNLTAGRKAIASIAYESALKYLTTGIALLAKNSWKTDYEVTLSLHEKAAEAAYLNGDFEQMDRLVKVVLSQTSQVLDRILVYDLQIQSLGTQYKSLEAIQLGLKVLESLDIHLSQFTDPTEEQQAVSRLQKKLDGRSLEDWVNLPKMKDPRILAAMRILGRILCHSYQAAPHLFLPTLCREIELSIKYGNTPVSAIAYATYGFLLCGVYEDIEAGNRVSEVALGIFNKFNKSEFKGLFFLSIWGGIKPWVSPIRDLPQHLEFCYTAALESGSLSTAAYALLYNSFSIFLSGISLEILQKKLSVFKQEIAQLKEELCSICTDIYHQFTLNLLSQSNSLCLLKGEVYDETEMLPRHLAANDLTGLFHFYFCKLILSYLAQDFTAAVENANSAQKYLAGVSGQMVVPQFYFYDALARLAVYGDCEEEEQQKILEKLEVTQAKFRKWAHHAPMNFLNKQCLIEAEFNRILGNKLEAIELYDKAITLSSEYDYLHEEAMAGELAAKFYLDLDKTSISTTYAALGKNYLEKAYYAYDRWGAQAKLQQLEQHYPLLLKSLQSWDSWDFNYADSLANYTIVSHPKLNLTTTSVSSSSSISEALDLAAVIKASQALSGQLKIESSMETLMRILLENVGAETGALILCRDGSLVIEARAFKPQQNESQVQITSLQSIPFESTSDLPSGLINYVWRTSQTVVLDDAVDSTTFASDPYIIEYQPKSMLCTSICNQGKTIGLLYLENNLTRGAFTRERLDFLKFLTTQAAISLENAFLYQNLAAANQRLEDANRTLEEKVDYRTQELKAKNEELDEKNKCLQQTLKELKHTQTQLIQSEKMSGLGQLVSGVAHEINNPVSFIAGNLFHANEYVNDLLNLIDLYNQDYPNPTPKIQEMVEEIEMDFMVQDLPKLMNSMKTGCDRIKTIVLGLRNFSRLDESQTKLVNLHEGIENSLMLLQHRLQGKGDYLEIVILKNYGNLPVVHCYASQINQVFINILNNAIDALETLRVSSDSLHRDEEKCARVPQISIQTEAIATNLVQIQIADNGTGMTEDVSKKVFDPFFTTKPVGKGTGLGMSISYQIIVEEHGGSIECHSALGKGSTFIIQLPSHRKN